MLNDTAEILAPEQTSPKTEAPIDITDAEQQLTTEISRLWAEHTDTQSAVKKTQKELKAIRASLGERLYEMKQLLAKPGCQGGWSSFLDSHGISRTTADRLVNAHSKSVGADDIGTTGAIRELTGEEIAELAKATWKKLEKKLGTKHAAYAFLGRLAAESGLVSFKFQRDDKRGLALVQPDTTAVERVQIPMTEAETVVG